MKRLHRCHVNVLRNARRAFSPCFTPSIASSCTGLPSAAITSPLARDNAKTYTIFWSISVLHYLNKWVHSEAKYCYSRTFPFSEQYVLAVLCYVIATGYVVQLRQLEAKCRRHGARCLGVNILQQHANLYYISGRGCVVAIGGGVQLVALFG